MATLALTLLVFLAAMGGLALGLLSGRGPLKGSCGGIACLGRVDCAACPSRKEHE